jgi:hypothetical protein
MVLLRDEHFFLQIWRMGYPKSVFSSDLKNVNLIFLKSAPKKRFSQKAVLGKQKTFSGCTFYKGQMHILEINIKSWIFDTSFDLFKGKKLSSHRRVNVYFL